MQGHPSASTAHIKVDDWFVGVLSEDFSIDRDTTIQALDGEPQKQAIAICEWAERQNEPAEALTNWARKHRKGRYGRPIARLVKWDGPTIDFDRLDEVAERLGVA